MQTASAFSSVQGALSFFITVYRQLAEWQAVVNRLDGFEAGIAAARDLATRSDRIHVVETTGDRRHRPQGPGAATAERNAAGERGRIQLPQGRAHADDRPVGLRQIDAVPRHRRHLAVRRRLNRRTGGRNIDDAAAAAVFPDRIAARGGRISRPRKGRSPTARSAARSKRWDCPSSRRRPDEHGHWNRTLSLGEQQRLGLARALLHAPQLPVPRRGHRLARRALGSGAVPPARGKVAGHHHRLDRPPLDAGRLPPAQHQYGA